MASISAPYPDRKVLEGVPRVNFYEGGKRCPEDIILPSVMRAILEYLGEEDYGCKHCLAQNPDCKILCTYAHLVGVSGAAAFLSWKEGWHGDNVAIFYMSDDAAAPGRRIFEAVGYAYEALEKSESGQNSDDSARFRQAVIESISRGMPVIGYGIIGPPEAAIITGYDEGGDVLIGWSFFQNSDESNPGVEFEPSGYFRKRDWFKDTACLLVIGEKQVKPPLAETVRDALAWMLRVTRTPMVRPEPDAPEWYQHRHNGLAAYDAWAEHLLQDDDFPDDNEAVLRQRYQVHTDAVGTVAEARWYGSLFLAEIAEHFVAGPRKPGTSGHILHAAACYAAEHDLMWKIWDLAGGISSPDAYRAMTDPAVRRAMVDIIRQAREQDAMAAGHLEQALG